MKRASKRRVVSKVGARLLVSLAMIVSEPVVYIIMMTALFWLVEKNIFIELNALHSIAITLPSFFKSQCDLLYS
jgi:hypothetical protein